MSSLFLCIVVFLILLAVFDLVVGVSNDAVNFLNSAIGAKVARFHTIVTVAAVGVFLGASMSNGMMDVARHGIMTPMYFSFYDVMCVFLAVMITDVILLDVFNTLGMPTSTTVSMVFELLGGSFAIALLKIIRKATAPDGSLLTLGDCLNTEKAMSVILGIFLSVAIAFILGALVQWIARVVFTFTYDRGSTLRKGILAGLSVTIIIWFLLINGLKGSSFMTAEVKATINANAWLLLGGGAVIFSVIMTALSALRVPVLKGVVLLGTLALAMAFAGNDLVNFVGVPLTGLESWREFVANDGADASSFMMSSLMESAQTPTIYLVIAGLVMVLSLIFSRKAQNVVRTSVDLSRQDEGDEMFGSSAAARTIVRGFTHSAAAISAVVPRPVAKWVDSRFNSLDTTLPEGAAFDQIRAIVNLVLASLLVALGTSLKLPLSTTYVTFMVAMGTSLADRAWSRESAVFRITGVLSVIGGWFITAGVAFIACFLLTNAIFFGGAVVMILAIVLAIIVLLRSNLRHVVNDEEEEEEALYRRIMRSRDGAECWQLLTRHLQLTASRHLHEVANLYGTATEAFFHEEYRPLKKVSNELEELRSDIKRQRRRQILGLRRVTPILAAERNTWYFLCAGAISQLLHSMIRLTNPCREHVGNNFTPVTSDHMHHTMVYVNQAVNLMERASNVFANGELSQSQALRADADSVRRMLSDYRKVLIEQIHNEGTNLESMTTLLNLVQETQEMLSALRHLLRGAERFTNG